jgi:hypothetical protein
MRGRRRDVIYARGFLSPELEEDVYDIAPTVYFAHVNVGTCISACKTTWFPVAQPVSGGSDRPVSLITSRVDAAD